MWEPFVKLFKLINSEQEPHQISLGICLGMVAGFTPTLSLHNLLVLFVLLVVRVNISAFIVGFVLFSILAFLLDPAFHGLGEFVLRHPALIDVWTPMYNEVFWRLTGFNNTVLMGSLIISLIAFVPAFFLFNFMIRNYRTRIQARYKESSRRLTRFLKLSSLLGRYSQE
ncbi:MAG: TIGR03546 family protein [Gammaproteobacteria bacterium]|nr:TIGR03546 family protein [Gammaproteobacteria bacterium]